MKLLLLRKITSRSFMKISGGINPEKELNRRSKNDKSFMSRMGIIGKDPEMSLLLMSSSYRYGSFARLSVMGPENLLELAWKRATSGS